MNNCKWFLALINFVSWITFITTKSNIEFENLLCPEMKCNLSDNNCYNSNCICDNSKNDKNKDNCYCKVTGVYSSKQIEIIINNCNYFRNRNKLSNNFTYNTNITIMNNITNTLYNNNSLEINDNYFNSFNNHSDINNNELIRSLSTKGGNQDMKPPTKPYVPDEPLENDFNNENIDSNSVGVESEVKSVQKPTTTNSGNKPNQPSSGDGTIFNANPNKPKKPVDYSNYGDLCKKADDCSMGLVCNSTAQCDVWGSECVSDNECKGFCCEGGWCLSDAGSCSYLQSYRNVDVATSTFVFSLMFFGFTGLFYFLTGRSRMAEFQEWLEESERNQGANPNNNNQQQDQQPQSKHHQEMVVNIKHNRESPLGSATKKKVSNEGFDPNQGGKIY